MGSTKASADDSSSFMLVVWGSLLVIAFMAVAWPYFLGTWIAVQSGAGNPSTARAVTGWVFEALWLIGWAALAAWVWRSDQRDKEEARRREVMAREQEASFGPAGFRLYKSAEASVSSIAASEAARAGWLGDPAKFDFRADLEAIADNLRRAQEIRSVTADAASIKNFTQSDNQMLHDAKRLLAQREESVNERVELIERCAQQASDIDRALQEDRENIEMAKRRDELRDRLSPILYSPGTAPTETPSEAADVVTARVSAFHELKALIDTHRIEE